MKITKNLKNLNWNLVTANLLRSLSKFVNLKNSLMWNSNKAESIKSEYTFNSYLLLLKFKHTPHTQYTYIIANLFYKIIIKFIRFGEFTM